MSLATVQQLAKECLTANETLAALDYFIQLDPAATAAALDAQEDNFNRVLATRGLAVIIGYPGIEKVAEAEGGHHGCGRVALDLIVPVVFCENETVNRGAADPAAEPAIAPTGLIPATLFETAFRYLMRDFRPAQKAIGRPEPEAGFTVHTLLVTRRMTLSRA